jgi:hypothetical protein
MPTSYGFEAAFFASSPLPLFSLASEVATDRSSFREPHEQRLVAGRVSGCVLGNISMFPA